jgi:hypothetical protein
VVNKAEVASCSNLDVASIIKETSVKFPGGDARHYLFGGGWEEGLQQMNLILIAINAKIANREMLDDKINQISNLEKKTEGSRQAISSKNSPTCEILPRILSIYMPKNLNLMTTRLMILTNFL